MRLTKLKLSGFKSFVDPTSVPFPGQLAAVIGPNGCGKSNIIDAVRWVLGESKAAELRGESIQDVIFKGSGTRKEVSRASVELSFDNTQGRAAGQWSQYSEITVRRVLDREGNSNYYINNLHVRRRDVIDLFLGTGLGPRAYAIIGQGMVSRIVEARPDEMRVFLEEAAGVTRYKERRRETQNRLEDARENLARVDDIRGELDGQIGRLEVQAEIARQYRELQQNLVERQNLLWLKKRNDARRDAEKAATDVAQAINRVEEETAQLREIEARLEEARSTHFAASDELHAAQGEKYAAEAEVGRLESELNHVRDSRTRLEARKIKLEDDLKHWTEQSQVLQQEAQRWQDLLLNAGARSEICEARHAETSAQLEQAEQSLQDAQEQFTSAQRAVQGSEQNLRLADADRGHADRALDGLRQRRLRLEEEKGALAHPDPLEVERSQEQVAQTEEMLADQQGRLSDIQSSLPGLESQVRQARERLQAATRKLTESRARVDALKQLQARVQQNGEIGTWLKNHGLDNAAPLWKSLQVESGWETAVEAVLRERLAALTATPDAAQAALAAPPPSTFALALPAEGYAGEAPSAESLRAKIRCTDSRWAAVLDEWLAGLNAADELAGIVPAAGQAYVNRAGHLLTRHGLVLYVPDARTHGLIERQREIEELDAQLDQLLDDESIAREAMQQAEQQLAAAQAELAATRRRVQEIQQQLHLAQVEALKLNQAQARYEERVGQIDRDLAEVLRAEEDEIADQERAAEQSELHREQLDTLRERLHAANDLLKQSELAVREVRALEQQYAREAQEARFSSRECESKLDDNARASETAVQQLERVQSERQTVEQELVGISDAVLHEQLQSALAERGEKEARLAEKRDILETAGTALRELEEGRLRIEQSLNPLRERINDLRLKQQAVELNEANFQERLVEAGIVSETEEAPLQALLVPGLRESALNGDITRLNGEIEALGAVNLAALDELNSARERKGFLDAQSGDLATAINTLEDAIRRIDRETREQLQETYDTVNRHFGELFPSLFGGGEAKLVLTGEEILDSGIQIMAHPPGKKNTTIHMLSGGEKALTAIALVFAMFQLNPAPFCLLDEVDAPLDDSNTERFCEMLKRMSSQTQFIYISHNKITMEMAQQLIGVTMQERGVSRIVDVDMEEAMRMSEEQKVA